MPTITDTITTPDGACPVRLFTPEGSDPWRGIVMYPDAGGVRESFYGMATELAGFGYAVLLPDVYYRHGNWAPFHMQTVFDDPKERERLMTMLTSITPDMMATDAGAFFDYLAGRPEVRGQTFGITGYCMGGRTSVTVAGRVPDPVAVAAAFHPGGLVTDAADSPHLLADRMTATVYVAGAENDASFTKEQAATLDEALRAAGVKHTVERYPAEHGFAVPDNPRYDAAAAARHWAAMRELFGATLAG
ncbi:dienelactone hydrolase family protein [Mycolicibacter icosiumassiliensis]|uniref:dienelactone hydrolase family protein n=1 Tax=Mycolicibacter icosiumassiliensis TaxID=1792835 RepID=UPI00082DB187|nr:dienelactone hydrolase family protein [Mycolicibacter icosiumassiliensis]